ncbi:MAG: hypothetical protein IPQ23_10810 [Cytophagaceae bacterium]|nr:hypothetical protein [Cytophagaceae bacterium]
MKKIIFIALILGLRIGAKAQFPQMQALTDQITQHEKIYTRAEMAKMVSTLKKENILNDEGEKIINGYLLDGQPLAIFDSKVTLKEEQKSMLDIYGGILKSVDSLLMNKTAMLGFLGYLDMAKNFEKVNLKKSPEKFRLKPIFGAKMSFDVNLQYDQNNPLKYTYDNEKVRPYYISTMKSLQSAGLISDLVLADALRWLEKDEVDIYRDFNVFFYAAARNLFYENYDSFRKSQLSKIDSLQYAGLLSGQNSNSLKSQIKDYKLLEKSRILEKIPGSVILKKSDFTGLSKLDYYKKLAAAVSQLIPELKIEKISLNTIPIDDIVKKEKINLDKFIPGFNINDFMTFSQDDLQIKIGNDTYKRTFEDFSIVSDNPTFGKFLEQIYKIKSNFWISDPNIQLFNDYLSDIGHPKRLLLIGNEMSLFPKPSFEEKALMLLDEAQFEVVKNKMAGIKKMVGNTAYFDRSNSIETLMGVAENLQSMAYIPAGANLRQFILDNRSSKSNNYKDLLISRSLMSSSDYIGQLPAITEIKDLVELRNTFEAIKQKAGNSFQPEALHDNFDQAAKEEAGKPVQIEFGFKANGIEYLDSLTYDPNSYMALGLSGFPSQIIGNINAALGDAEKKIRMFKDEKFQSHLIMLSPEKISELQEKVGFYIETDVQQAAVEVVEQAVSNMLQKDTVLNFLKSNDLIADSDIEKIEASGIEYFENAQQVFQYLKDHVEIDIKDYVTKTEEDFISDILKKSVEKFLPGSVLKITSIDKSPENIDDFIAKFKVDDEEYYQYFYSIGFTFRQIKEQSGTEDMYFEKIYFPQSFINVLRADKGLPANIQQYYNNQSKYFFAATTDDFNVKMVTYSGSTPGKKEILDMFKTLSVSKLIKAKTEAELNEAVKMYRAKAPSYTANDMFDEDTHVRVLFENVTNQKIPEFLSFLSENQIQIQQYIDNIDKVNTTKDLELQKESPAEKIIRKGSFMIYGKKVVFEIPLLGENGYYCDFDEFFEKIIKPVNTAIGTRNPKKLYLGEDQFLYFITPDQKTTLESLGLYFR